MEEKKSVETFWNEASCGENLFLKGDTEIEAFQVQAEKRYFYEPYIIPFADFEKSEGKMVLEIGVGLGSDHQKFAEAGAKLSGIDLTLRAITHTRNRLYLFNLTSDLKVGDAENLDFPDNTFDLVYSWGVIHHSPETPKAIREIHRVLKPGGEAKVMIYHKNSIVGYLLWLRYGLMNLKPFTSLKSIYSQYLESPGTKAYTIDEAQNLFKAFDKLNIKIELSHGDLLSEHTGQRHQGILLKFAQRVFPSSIIKRSFKKNGLFMLISAIK